MANLSGDTRGAGLTPSPSARNVIHDATGMAGGASPRETDMATIATPAAFTEMSATLDRLDTSDKTVREVWVRIAARMDALVAEGAYKSRSAVASDPAFRAIFDKPRNVRVTPGHWKHASATFGAFHRADATATASAAPLFAACMRVQASASGVTSETWRGIVQAWADGDRTAERATEAADSLNRLIAHGRQAKHAARAEAAATRTAGGASTDGDATDTDAPATDTAPVPARPTVAEVQDALATITTAAAGMSKRDAASVLAALEHAAAEVSALLH